MRQSKAQKSLDKVRDLALDMEVPLTDASEFVLALRIIGYGLTAHDHEEGAAVAAIACAASDRLDELRKVWNKTRSAAAKG